MSGPRHGSANAEAGGLALLERQVRESLAAFTTIGNYLAGVSGRRSIVWLTAGFPHDCRFPRYSGNRVRGARFS